MSALFLSRALHLANQQSAPAPAKKTPHIPTAVKAAEQFVQVKPEAPASAAAQAINTSGQKPPAETRPSDLFAMNLLKTSIIKNGVKDFFQKGGNPHRIAAMLIAKFFSVLGESDVPIVAMYADRSYDDVRKEIDALKQQNKK